MAPYSSVDFSLFVDGLDGRTLIASSDWFWSLLFSNGLNVKYRLCTFQWYVY